MYKVFPVRVSPDATRIRVHVRQVAQWPRNPAAFLELAAPTVHVDAYGGMCMYHA